MLHADTDVARGVGARVEEMCHKVCCVYFFVLRFIGGVVKVGDMAPSSHLAPRRHKPYLLQWMRRYTKLRQVETMTKCLKFTCKN